MPVFLSCRGFSSHLFCVPESSLRSVFRIRFSDVDLPDAHTCLIGINWLFLKKMSARSRLKIAFFRFSKVNDCNKSVRKYSFDWSSASFFAAFLWDLRSIARAFRFLCKLPQYCRQSFDKFLLCHWWSWDPSPLILRNHICVCFLPTAASSIWSAIGYHSFLNGIQVLYIRYKIGHAKAFFSEKGSASFGICKDMTQT